jgi:ribosomal protein S18 acetylase RimI-like enzyme
MTIDLRPACSDDYNFALNLYLKAIKPLVVALVGWVDEEQEAQFANLWRPDDTKIITHEGEDIGWVEFRWIGDELFLKQLYITPKHQRQGIGSQIIRLLNEQAGTAKSMALFVLRNNPVYHFYQRHGFEVVRETHTTLVMRRMWLRRLDPTDSVSVRCLVPRCGVSGQ